MRTIERTETGLGAGALVGDRYRLRSRFGRGSGGTVWRAWDEQLGRTVAVKEIPRELARYPGASLAEARLAARMNHRAVATLYDFIEHDDVDWIIMEALTGRTLAATVHRHGTIGPDEGWYIAERVLDALRAVHAAGLVHGDVKPANVQLCDDGRVVLLDFGLAGPPRRTGGSARHLIAGSLPYIAPEILQAGAYSPGSDLFALGMTLYVAVTGRRPQVDLAAGRHLMPEPPPVRDAWGAVLDGLLDPDPGTRLDAATLARACRQARLANSAARWWNR